MKFLVIFLALVAAASAFAPSPAGKALPLTIVQMGLFDDVKNYFSEESKQQREEEKQRMIEEQEEAYREVLERRRNPEMMEGYMEDRKERLKKFSSNDE